MNSNSVESIFSAALEISSTDDRAAYLDEACGQDTELRKRVEILLDSQHEFGSFLEQPAVNRDVTIDQSTIPEGPGATIGPYKLLQQIGEGGFGVVYMAQQTEPIKRRVALKIIKLGMDTKQVVGRFEIERQALALMDHPNIAKVLDAGSTDSGRPYFVMELVRGYPITQFCDENKLTTPERLELFIPVCQAIQHAHQKAIIHRDIKPSNVLVTMHDDKPVPKVIDFGIAKATQSELTTKTVFTQFEQFIGTPAYMSPEQAQMSGLDIDTRCDIYALGVLLYELLTGRPPLDPDKLRQGGFDEIRRRIREEEPPRPSSRVSTMDAVSRTSLAMSRQTDAVNFGRQLRGDLDWIIMKAIEKDRTRRYDTANGLAMDINRYMENEPIAARPPSVFYRFSKLARRNKTAFVATTAIVTALVIGFGAAVWGLAEAKLQRNVAEKRLVSSKIAEQEALRQRNDAREARKQAADRADDLARRIYFIHLANAGRALLDNDYLRARAELDSCPEEHRGWEWRYLIERIQATFPQSFPGSQQPVFTRDGTRLIAIGAVGTPAQRMAHIWDTSSGDLVATFEHDSRVFFLAMSPDERWIAGGDFDGNLFVWDVNTGKKSWSVKQHEGAVNGLAFSHDSHLIATAGWDGSVKVFNATSGEMRFSIPVTEGGLRKVMFSPNGRWISTGSEHGEETATLIDVDQEEIAARLPGVGHMLPTFDPGGTRFATSNRDGSITLWNWDGKQPTRHLSWQASDVEIFALEFSADGIRLVSGDFANRVKVWEVATGRELAALDSGAVAPWLSFNPRGDRVAVFTISGGIRLWQYGEQEMGRIVRPLDNTVMARFSPDGRRIIASCAAPFPTLFGYGTLKHGPIVVLEAVSGTNLVTIGGDLHSACWTPDGQYVLAGAEPQHAIRMYDAAKGDLVQTFAGQTELADAAVAQSGRQLVSVFRDGAIGVLDLQSNEQSSVFSANMNNSDTLTAMGISPDKTRVAVSFFRDYTVEIWDVQTQKPIRSLGVPGQIIHRIVFSGDGNRLYVGSGRLSRFDITSGQETNRYTGHSGAVLAMAISPDEKQIVSGDDSGRVIVWDALSAQPLITLTSGDQPVTSLDWSSDGRRIVAGKGDGTVQIWTLKASR